MSMSIDQAFVLKAKEVMAKLEKLDKRSHPRPPARLRWLVDSLCGSYGSATCPPPGYEGVTRSYSDIRTPTGPKDRLARTFVALEEIEEWITRAAAGAARHQQEVERQSNGDIVRLETYAALH